MGMIPDEMLHGIDLSDDNTKSQLMALLPFVMSGNNEGLLAQLEKIDPELRTALVAALISIHDYTCELLEVLDPEYACVQTDEPREEWPEEVGGHDHD